MELIPGSIEHLACKLNTIQESWLAKDLKLCKNMLELCMSGSVLVNDFPVQQYLYKYDTLFTIWNNEFLEYHLNEGELVVRDIINQLKKKEIYSKHAVEYTKIKLRDKMSSGNKRDFAMINSVVVGIMKNTHRSSVVISDIIKQLQEKGIDISAVFYDADLSVSSLGTIQLTILCDTDTETVMITKILVNDFLAKKEQMKHVLLRLLNHAVYKTSLEEAFDMVIINKNLLDIGDQDEDDDENESENAFN